MIMRGNARRCQLSALSPKNGPTGDSRKPVMRKLPVEPVCRMCVGLRRRQITTMIPAIPFAMRRGGSADRHEA